MQRLTDDKLDSLDLFLKQMEERIDSNLKKSNICFEKIQIDLGSHKTDYDDFKNNQHEFKLKMDKRSNEL